MNEKQEQKQIVVRMDRNEVKDLKQFCLDNDITITDAIKNGIKLFKGIEHIEYTADGYCTLKLSVETIKEIGGFWKAKETMDDFVKALNKAAQPAAR